MAMRRAGTTPLGATSAVTLRVPLWSVGRVAFAAVRALAVAALGAVTVTVAGFGRAAPGVTVGTTGLPGRPTVMAAGRVLLGSAFAGLDGLLDAGCEGLAKLLVFFHALGVVTAVIAIVASAVMVAPVVIAAVAVVMAVDIAVMPSPVMVPIMLLTAGLGNFLCALGGFAAVVAAGMIAALVVALCLSLFTAFFNGFLHALCPIFFVALDGLGPALAAIVVITAPAIVIIDHKSLVVEIGIGAFLAGRTLGAALATTGTLRAPLLHFSELFALFLVENGAEFLLVFLAHLRGLGADFFALDVAIAGGG